MQQCDELQEGTPNLITFDNILAGIVHVMFLDSLKPILWKMSLCKHLHSASLIKFLSLCHRQQTFLRNMKRMIMGCIYVV